MDSNLAGKDLWIPFGAPKHFLAISKLIYLTQIFLKSQICTMFNSLFTMKLSDNESFYLYDTPVTCHDVNTRPPILF